MFSFFRINDPYRVLIIFFFLILIDLPFMIGGLPVNIQQLEWMVIGEKLAEGSILYVGLWDDISPFSAGIFWMLDEVFGRSVWAYHLLGLLLIIIQAALFNNILLKHKAYNENTYTPALIYMLLMSLFIDFYSLSPVLIGLTFILLALDLLFNHIQTWQKNDARILTIGFFMGLASLSFFPFFLMSFLVFFAFIFFTGTSIRRNLLFIYGFLVPFIIIWLYYFWHGGANEFLRHYVSSIFIYKGKFFLPLQSILIVAAIPGLFMVISMLKVFSSPGYTNYQVRLQQIMLIMFVIGILAFTLSNEKSPHLLMLFSIPAAFFINHYFLTIRKRIILEIIFLVFIVLVILVNHGTYHDFFVTDRWIEEQELLVEETAWNDLIADQKVLFLGDNIHIYQDAHLATPYFNWKLSQDLFTSLDYYDNLSLILKSFKKDPPSVLIDPNQVMPDIFARIQPLNESYQKLNEYEHTYILRPDPILLAK